MVRKTTSIARRHHEAGMSLVEILIASSLMLIAAIGILPLFITAIQNNVAGFESSQITSHTRSQLEGLQSTPIDHESLNLVATSTSSPAVRSAVGGGDELPLGQFYWDQAAASPNPAFARLGDGDWIQDESAAKGLIFWRRQSIIRQYAYADISDGVVDVNQTGQLFTLGHPKLFDRPLGADAHPSAVQFKEQDVEIESQRAKSLSSGTGNLKTSYFRTH